MPAQESIGEDIPTVQEAIESEQAVSEVIEDVVVESAAYAAQEDEQRQGFDTEVHQESQSVPVEDHMKVPPSNYIAEMTRREEQMGYFTPQVQAQPQPQQAAPVPQPPQPPKKEEEDDLYSMKHFNL